MIRLAQLSDLHLSGQVGTDPSYQRFLAVLTQAVAQCPNFLLLTGDLVSEGQKAGYAWLFAILDKTKLPYMCLAGNHDVCIEHGNFYTLSATACHPTLKGIQIQTLGAWQVIGLNSAVAGAIGGHITKDDLDFMVNHLKHNDRPTLIALHHHPTAVGSAWLDTHLLDNASALQAAIAPFAQVKGVLCGHVHQAHCLSFAGVPLYTCPAVARQFLPFAHDFALDDKGAGFRVVELYGNQPSTHIHRLDATPQ